MDTTFRSSRRDFLCGAALAAAGIPLVKRSAWGQAAGYAPPASPRVKLDFNLGWKFLRDDAEGAEAVGFNDVSWTTVTTPHTFNDVDSFRTIISHSGGDRGTYKGLAWYRKHFSLPDGLKGRRLFLEFEGMRQAGDIFLNGKAVGLYENGITAYGMEITDSVVWGKENVLAVKVDNHTNYLERATGTTFEWNANDFNPDFGGINQPVWLHVTGPIYQTLPVYYGLETAGVYVWGENFDIGKHLCDVGIEAEVKNTSGDRATVELSAMVVDGSGKVAATLDGSSVDMVADEKTVLTAGGRLQAARWWSVEEPNLYEVYTVLRVDGTVVDVCRTTTGFRKLAYPGGAGTGGVHINDRFVYLKGFAQRSSDEWAGLGQAYPAWMHDYQAKLIRDCHGNYIRWMHIAPQRADADACARHGIVQVCPAGDKERDAVGRQWEQRMEVMRDTIIRYRNNPSVLFWEAGNTVVTVEHLQAMIAMAKQWDEHGGGRPVGARGNDNVELNTATTPIAGYFGVMIGQDPKVDALEGGAAMFRGYSADRRDRAPIIETEDFRDEGARRFWDDLSPPYYGFKKGPSDTYEYTSESFAVSGVKRYWDYWSHRISLPDKTLARWSGYASIYFSDADADGRQDSSEVARVSGKVDAVRLPKEIYFAHRVIQNEAPDLHVLGHWSYPADRNVVKTVYVIANTGSVELFVNGKSLGVKSEPDHGYIFAFDQVAFVPGTLRAVAKLNGKVAVEHVLSTAGASAGLKLTPIAGPEGWRADGADIVLIDVEVVDAKGQRCPTDDARVDFSVAGPGVWRGGYNSGKTDSTNNLWLNTELGINRVAVRSTREAGVVTVTAKREGLTGAKAELRSQKIDMRGKV